MRNYLFFAFALVIFVQASLAWPHHKSHKESCSFQSEKGSYDLKLLNRALNGRDWILRDDSNKESSFYFNPCNSVHQEQCPSKSAFCELSNDGTSISFGSSTDKRWNIVEDGIEIAYSNGDSCSNGVLRKTVVQISCSHPIVGDQLSQRTSITDMSIEDCLVTLKMKSPYGCPVEQFCTSFEETECSDTEELCSWNNGTCVMNEDSTGCIVWGRHRVSITALFGILLSIFMLLSCGVGLCLCACCRARRNRRNMRLPVVAPKKRRSSKKKNKNKNKKSSTLTTASPSQDFVYQPLQQYVPMTQFYPMTQNPYGEPAAYPMVQFIPPTAQEHN